MKITSLCFCFCLLLGTTSAFAQMTREAYAPGDKTFQLGVGLGNTSPRYYSYDYYGFGIPLSAALEFGISDYFSVGPYAAYVSSGYRSLGDRYRRSIFSVGAKGSFHYLRLINEPLELGIDETRLDLYLSVYLGAGIYSYSDNISNSSILDFGTVIGGRYMFNEQLGGYTELGYGALAVWTIGVSYRF